MNLQCVSEQKRKHQFDYGFTEDTQQDVYMDTQHSRYMKLTRPHDVPSSLAEAKATDAMGGHCVCTPYHDGCNVCNSVTGVLTSTYSRYQPGCSGLDNTIYLAIHRHTAYIATLVEVIS